MNKHKRYDSSVRGKYTRRLNYETKWNFLMNFKAQIGCKECKINEPIILTFHHPDNNKKFHVSASSACRSWKEILKEIEKCNVLCSNHHILEHGGAFRLKGCVG